MLLRHYNNSISFSKGSDKINPSSLQKLDTSVGRGFLNATQILPPSLKGFKTPARQEHKDSSMFYITQNDTMRGDLLTPVHEKKPRKTFLVVRSKQQKRNLEGCYISTIEQHQLLHQSSKEDSPQSSSKEGGMIDLKVEQPGFMSEQKCTERQNSVVSSAYRKVRTES